MHGADVDLSAVSFLIHINDILRNSCFAKYKDEPFWPGGQGGASFDFQAAAIIRATRRPGRIAL
jgi:hypothetical protein